MWLHTPDGFYSVVEKPGDGPGHLTIRARDRQDLVRLRDQYIRTLGPIRYNAHTDYPYRARVTRRALGQALARLVGRIHYDNFKDEVKHALGPRRADILLKVWHALTAIEPPQARGKRQRAQLRRLMQSIPPWPWDAEVERERVSRLLALGTYRGHGQ